MVQFIDRGDGIRLAATFQPGRGPTLLFLPGYMSDMSGTKAQHLLQWAADTGRQCLLLDYSGCGRSEGDFDSGSIRRWAADAKAVADALAPGPLLPIGSSMGGWIMLHLALADRPRIHALVGIAAAPDFTDWGFSVEEKVYLNRYGRLERPNPYGDAPTVTTRRFWASGEANRVTIGPIAIDAPVRLLHGQRDRDVPWQLATRIAELLRSDDVQTWLVKDGDHRLSRDQDIALLIRAVESVAP